MFEMYRSLDCVRSFSDRGRGGGHILETPELISAQAHARVISKDI